MTKPEPMLPLSVVRALAENYTSLGIDHWLDEWERAGYPPAHVVESEAGSSWPIWQGWTPR